MTTASRDIMDRLKAETAALHDEAEHHPFQSHLVKGKLSRQGYVRYLAAKFHIHVALEDAIRRAAVRHETIASMQLDERFREAALRRDLAYFGAAPEATAPLPSVSRLNARIRSTLESTPMSLLGHFYVLEGSTNGTHYIARAVRRAYDLNGSSGTAYLDPYGDDQRLQWARFKEQMRAVPLTDQQKDEIVDAAKGMFRAIIALSEELMALEGKGSESGPALTKKSSGGRKVSGSGATCDTPLVILSPVPPILLTPPFSRLHSP